MYKESHPFYHTARWKKVRQLALQRDGGMCQDCMEGYRKGLKVKPRRATLVHHLIPREQRPDLALNLDNLLSLCEICHNRRHPEKGRRQPAEQGPVAKIRVIKV